MITYIADDGLHHGVESAFRRVEISRDLRCRHFILKQQEATNYKVLHILPQ